MMEFPNSRVEENVTGRSVPYVEYESKRGMLESVEILNRYVRVL